MNQTNQASQNLSSPQKPHIGLLLCTYNGEAFLAQQLQSITTQTRLPDEFLIIDDCSSDQTIKIIETFIATSSIPVHLIQRKTNQGPCSNFLSGLSEMNADWILFADQDDIWNDNKIEIFAQAIAKFPNARMFFSDAELIDENNAQISPSLWQKIRFNPIDRQEFLKSNLSIIIKRPIVIGMSCMVHRGFAQQIPAPPYAILHDEWLSYYFATSNSIQFIESKTAKYRQHSMQVTGVKQAFLLKNIFRKFCSPPLAPHKDLLRIEHLRKFICENASIDHQQSLLKIAEQYIDHLNIRCRYYKNIFIAIDHLTPELFNQRYSTYSAGLMSFALDLRRNLFH